MGVANLGNVPLENVTARMALQAEYNRQEAILCPRPPDSNDKFDRECQDGVPIGKDENGNDIVVKAPGPTFAIAYANYFGSTRVLMAVEMVEGCGRVDPDNYYSP